MSSGGIFSDRIKGIFQYREVKGRFNGIYLHVSPKFEPKEASSQSVKLSFKCDLRCLGLQSFAAHLFSL
ncbi:hypothetical protein EXN66_Car000111 [Channa argus]|uniref:Uncharacterized protein n=1 Tax=Channa argus TaxID=215402 RepID=A0A6G1QW72_CHAAH|nr:hypothetical protein EXN66_Car000111 [Channa argus]